jgi:hypothetical protein
MRSDTKKRLAMLCGLAAALASGCSDLPSKPMPSDLATVEAGYGRAFGKVEFLENGEKRSWGDDPLRDGLTLYVRSARTGEMWHMQMERDGDFRWPLKPDDYLLLGYHLTQRQERGRLNTWTTTLATTGRLMMTFSVPRVGQAVYIGDLRIRVGRNRGASVSDQYEETLKRAESRLAAGGFQPVKALMRQEPETGSYARVIDICDGAWGVRCSQSLQGVEPLSPQGTAEGVPVTGSLTPRLEWQPSTRPGVTYDVVVYESLWITLAGLRSARIPGPRVAYAQGLREPGFAPAAELARGRIYAWSVRLRDGDTVSSWSSTSYSDFAGTSRGWGQSFHFATPSTR